MEYDASVQHHSGVTVRVEGRVEEERNHIEHETETEIGKSMHTEAAIEEMCPRKNG